MLGQGTGRVVKSMDLIRRHRFVLVLALIAGLVLVARCACIRTMR